jgi:hypothetical protein
MGVHVIIKTLPGLLRARQMFVGLALLGFGFAPSACRADFMLFVPRPNAHNELMLFNSDAHQNVTSFTASVGSQSGNPVVDISTIVAVDTGAGFANIKPTNNVSPAPLLTSITYTPKSQTLFNDFATNFQLMGPGNTEEPWTLTVVDKNGKSFVFSGMTDANANGPLPFDLAVIGTNGETIKSVTLFAKNGFEEVKQTEFSLSALPVPEPSTMGLALSGLASMALFGLRHLRRRAAAAAS